ncbi:neuralized-like protein 2 [Trichogramma pretiosum]|uniref:neuralized-like protein 2 n=1 Tax=Trichogramma pretiosum TaxID=7493 RepID=UPI0006C9BB0A|nr:neuralized-like protein 2 [Trichogramma pretiosum]
MSKSESKYKTRFHPCHGNNIVLYDDGTVAYRKSSFAESLVFSAEPLQLGEMFLLEIEKVERGWSGHMRIGLTQFDPKNIHTLDSEPALPNMMKAEFSWVFAMTDSSIIWDSFWDGSHNRSGDSSQRSVKETKLVKKGEYVHTSRGVIPYCVLKPNVDDMIENLLPTDHGSRVGVIYVPQANSDLAEMHFIINGEDQGAFATNIPYKNGPLYAVVDVYGTTKQVRIIQLYNASQTLQSACRDTILQCTKMNAVDSLPLPKQLRNYLLFQNE